MSTTTATIANSITNSKVLSAPKKDVDRQQANNKQLQQQQRSAPNNFTKKHKHDFKGNRKRSQSFTGGGKIFLFKRRKKESTLPTKFLLGGNICDPLNLNSLQDEEINRAMNAVTPKSSPLPTPPRRRAQIEVIIPPNICDPLNLIDYTDDATYEKQLSSPIKRGRKKSNRKNKRSSNSTSEIDNNNSTNSVEIKEVSETSETATSTSVASAPPKETDATTETAPKAETSIAPEEKVVINLNLDLPLASTAEKKEKPTKRKSTDEGKDVKKVRRVDSMDKIVSPVIPQPGAWKRPPNFWGGGSGIKSSKANNRTNSTTAPEKMPSFREKNKQYQYGNYNRYYGYRNPHHDVDLRLKCFAAHRGMFYGKDVLDIGCNIGHVTLSIARDFGAKSVVGLDIDKKLINIARKNVCYYVNCNSEDSNGEGIPQSVNKKGKKSTEKFFPISMPILYGPVDVPGMSKREKGKGFPHNVTFVQGNYVLEDESLVNLETPQFDIILALSITKWIHLNWGDAGLKQAFRRMYAQLRPGGRLILEPQAWSSYVKKKTLTETTYKNYKAIDFFPQNFTQYLLSSEVGFAKNEVMGCPTHHSKGFQRPIFVFTKSNLSPLYTQLSATSTPSYSSIAGLFPKRIYTNLQASPAFTETSITSHDQTKDVSDKNENNQIKTNCDEQYKEKTNELSDNSEKTTKLSDSVEKTTELSDNLEKTTELLNNVKKTTEVSDNLEKATEFSDNLEKITELSDNLEIKPPESVPTLNDSQQRNKINEQIEDPAEGGISEG